MNIFEARDLFAWTVKWCRNAYRDKEVTTRDVAMAIDHYQSDIDPWESAAAICEGRTLAATKKYNKK